MKKVNEIIEAAKSQISQVSIKEYRQISKENPASESVVNRIFAIFLTKYGHKWTSLFPEDDEELYNETKRTLGSDIAGIDLNHIPQSIESISPPNQPIDCHLCINSRDIGNARR